MSRFIIALLLLLPVQQASAECRSTANRAGCTTPNGAVGVGPNGAATIKTQGKSAPRSPITIIDQAKSYPARMSKARAATVRPRPYGRVALTLMAGGSVTSRDRAWGLMHGPVSSRHCPWCPR
jgi:hypothetical protein